MFRIEKPLVKRQVAKGRLSAWLHAAGYDTAELHAGQTLPDKLLDKLMWNRGVYRVTEDGARLFGPRGFVLHVGDVLHWLDEDKFRVITLVLPVRDLPPAREIGPLWKEPLVLEGEEAELSVPPEVEPGRVGT